MNGTTLSTNTERAVSVQSGWLMLPVIIGLKLGSLTLFIYSIAVSDQNGGHPNWLMFFAGLLGMILAVVLMPGFLNRWCNWMTNGRRQWSAT